MRNRPSIALALTLAWLGLGLPTAAATEAGLQTTPPSPSSAQPDLPPGVPPRPTSVPYAPAKPDSPVVEQLVAPSSGPLTVRKRAAHLRHRTPVRHYARRLGPPPRALERPALAGVTLLHPLPPPPPQPHIVVPLPAYPLEALAAAYLTPPPPIVCRRAPRIAGLPDPRLYREATLDCVPDTP